MKWLKRNRVVISILLSYVGMDSTHFVKYSMATIMYLWLPYDTGLQVIMSIPHLQKGPAMMTRCRGARGDIALWAKH